MEKLERIPVSVITGFLGSGKTTLINALIKQPGMNDIALIINEFGEIGLDNLLIESSIENTLLLENGCICCSIRGDLIDTINGLFTKVSNKTIPEFSRILIETTGLAHPGPIANIIGDDRVISKKCKLNNVITLVDSIQGITQLSLHKEVKIQISQADLCLISKCDAGSVREITKLENNLSKINPLAKMERIEKGRISPNTLFQEINPTHLNENRLKNSFLNNSKNSDHDHDDVSSWSFVSEREVDEAKFKKWIAMLYSLRPYAVLRMKCVVKFRKFDKPFLIQAVGNTVSDFEPLENWPKDNIQIRIVIIFKGLEERAINASFSRWVVND